MGSKESFADHLGTTGLVMVLPVSVRGCGL